MNTEIFDGNEGPTALQAVETQSTCRLLHGRACCGGDDRGVLSCQRPFPFTPRVLQTGALPMRRVEDGMKVEEDFCFYS